MKFLLSPILALVLPLIAGALASLMTQWSKKLWSALDTAHPAVKQTVVAGYAVLLNMATAGYGQSLCTDGAVYCDPSDIAWSALISYALAVSLHGQKRKVR